MGTRMIAMLGARCVLVHMRNAPGAKQIAHKWYEEYKALCCCLPWAVCLVSKVTLELQPEQSHRDAARLQLL